MAERSQAQVRIGRLNLLMPGKDRKAGQRLAQDLSDRLAARMPSGLTRRLDVVNVRVREPRHGSPATLGDAIAEAVISTLRSNGHG